MSTKTQYGLRAMVYLAKNKKKICSLREISKAEKIPFDYLEKIVSRIEKSGLIESKRGSHGGYFLAKSPSKVKTGEIVRILEGREGLVSCIADKNGRKRNCPLSKKCLTKKFWLRIQNSLEKALDSITLANLIQ